MKQMKHTYNIFKRGVTLTAAALCVVGVAITSVRAESSKLTIKLRDEAAVAAKFITLDAVAELSGDASLIKRAGTVMLGRKPRGAKGEEVEISFVEDRLVLAGITRKSFSFQGAKSVTVYNSDFVSLVPRSESNASEASSPKVDSVSAATTTGTSERGEVHSASGKDADTKEASNSAVDMAFETIRTTVASDLKMSGDDIVVQEVGRNIALSRLPKNGAQRLKDVVAADLGGPLGRRAYTLVVEIDGVEYGGLVLTVDVGRYASVVVANRSLVAKRVLVEGDVRLERLLFRTRSADYFTDVAAVLGMAPKNVVNVDVVLAPSDLEAALLIRRNEVVTVKAGLANFKAIALDDGTRGQRIRIRRSRVIAEEQKPAAAEKDPVLWGRVEANGSITIDDEKK